MTRIVKGTLQVGSSRSKPSDELEDWNNWNYEDEGRASEDSAGHSEAGLGTGEPIGGAGDDPDYQWDVPQFDYQEQTMYQDSGYGSG